MRKSLALGLVVLVACAVASFAVAAEKRASKPATHHITGDIVSVDATAKTLTVKEKEKEMTFTLADNGKVTVHGKTGSLDQLKAGDHVSVRYMEKDGASIAENVSVVKAPAPKKG